MSHLNIFWHPHQKLWNANLIRSLHKISKNQRFKENVVTMVIYIDSVIWMVKTRIKYLLSGKTPGSKRFVLNYFDIGTHREAKELFLFIDRVLPDLNCICNIYAFEACTAFYEEARKRTGHIDNLKFFHAALCETVPEDRKIRLYYFGKDGLGNSIYRDKGEQFEDIPAKRLSDIIHGEKIPLEGAVNIMRMNIEGAEFDVISDLNNHNLLRHFHGFYGMWDDVWKIDPERDKVFRMLLKKESISTFPFNGRDLNHEFRINMIMENLRRTIAHTARKESIVRKQ